MIKALFPFFRALGWMALPIVNVWHMLCVMLMTLLSTLIFNKEFSNGERWFVRDNCNLICFYYYGWLLDRHWNEAWCMEHEIYINGGTRSRLSRFQHVILGNGMKCWALNDAVSIIFSRDTSRNGVAVLWTFVLTFQSVMLLGHGR